MKKTEQNITKVMSTWLANCWYSGFTTLSRSVQSTRNLEEIAHGDKNHNLYVGSG